MSSQTDKKEEFRKYLEKANVIALLTNILTDLFEMDNKPDDPCQYIYKRFGEALNKKDTVTSGQPDVTTPAIVSESAKDVSMSEHIQSAPVDAHNSATTSNAHVPQTMAFKAAPNDAVPANPTITQPTAFNATPNDTAPGAEASKDESGVAPPDTQTPSAVNPSPPVTDGQPAAGTGNAISQPGAIGQPQTQQQQQQPLVSSPQNLPAAPQAPVP